MKAINLLLGASALLFCATASFGESERDVSSRNTNTPTTATESAAVFTVRSLDGAGEIRIDTSGAPELSGWAEQKLGPVLAEWYPKLVNMLGSEGYSAPKRVSIKIAPGQGVASTSGTRVTANAAFLKAELDRQAIGALLHELVHVVQQYGDGRNHPDFHRAPGWLVEGIADYIRWFKYEPQSHGADLVWLRKQRKPSLHYDTGYRISANFLNWICEHYDQPNDLVTRVNAACRQGKYTDALWKEWTGKTLPELNEEWQAALQKAVASS